MRQHILLPTDFSDNAWSAARYALELYSNTPCTFYFLHAWSFTNEGSRTYITSTYIDTVKEKAKKELEDLKEKAKKESTNTKHEFEVVFTTEPLLNIIEDVIKKRHINMVIMGTKGATGAKEFLFGSNTVTVINRMRLCPILVVPTAFNFEKLKQIAFPTDFNRPYGDELLHLKEIAKLYKSRIRIVHIDEEDKLSEVQNNNVAKLVVSLEDFNSSLHWMPDYGKKAQVIKDFIEEFDINLLAMINYKHSFIENIIKEPVVKKIGFHPIIPFLVIPSLEG